MTGHDAPEYTLCVERHAAVRLGMCICVGKPSPCGGAGGAGITDPFAAGWLPTGANPGEVAYETNGLAGGGTFAPAMRCSWPERSQSTIVLKSSVKSSFSAIAAGWCVAMLAASSGAGS